MDGRCVGIIHKHNNSEPSEQNSTPWATLDSSTCTGKKPVVCKLDSSEETLNIKPIPFPCIPENGKARKKRTSDNINENDAEYREISDIAGGNLWMI